MSQDASCIFCRIAKGEIPSEKILENERAFAFLDIQPLAEGHALVIPKAHHARYAQMSADDAAGVADLTRRVADLLQQKLGAAGFTIAANDGVAAGQEVPHVHVHVVPRAPGDGHGPIHRLFEPRKVFSRKDVQAVGAKLRA